MTSWKLIEDALRDGRSVLLWARIKMSPAEKDVLSPHRCAMSLL